MGRDILLIAERKELGNWVTRHKPKKTRNWDFYSSDEEPEYILDLQADFDTRISAIFSVLDEITEAKGGSRGLPDDVSPFIKQKAMRDGLQQGFITPTWLSLRELLTIDWRSAELREEYGDVSHFLNFLPKLVSLGEVDAVRVIFWYH